LRARKGAGPAARSSEQRAQGGNAGKFPPSSPNSNQSQAIPDGGGLARYDTCPQCGQTIAAIRLGVRLTPLKAAIFDQIKAAGDLGVTSIEIVADLYRDRRAVAPTTVKAHVNQINDLLVATDWRLRSDGRRWYLRREAS
jgi:hypothetical protein